MALNKPDRKAVIKAAKATENSISFSASGGSVYIGGTKYTDRHDALKKLNG